MTDEQAPLNETYEEYVFKRVKHHMRAADFFVHEAQEIDVRLKSKMDTNHWPPVAVDERAFAIASANFHATMANLFAAQINQWYESDEEWLKPDWMKDVGDSESEHDGTRESS